MEEKTVHIIVTGKVQGVCFRMYTEQKAKELDLKGTVKNRFDGSVEIYAQGASDSLNTFINWCWQGPPAAQVIDVKTNWLQKHEKFLGFSIIY